MDSNTEKTPSPVFRTPEVVARLEAIAKNTSHTENLEKQLSEIVKNTSNAKDLEKYLSAIASTNNNLEKHLSTIATNTRESIAEQKSTNEKLKDAYEKLEINLTAIAESTSNTEDLLRDTNDKLQDANEKLETHLSSIAKSAISTYEKVAVTNARLQVHLSAIAGNTSATNDKLKDLDEGITDTIGLLEKLKESSAEQTTTLLWILQKEDLIAATLTDTTPGAPLSMGNTQEFIRIAGERRRKRVEAIQAFFNQYAAPQQPVELPAEPHLPVLEKPQLNFWDRIWQMFWTLMRFLFLRGRDRVLFQFSTFGIILELIFHFGFLAGTGILGNDYQRLPLDPHVVHETKDPHSLTSRILYRNPEWENLITNPWPYERLGVKKDDKSVHDPDHAVNKILDLHPGWEEWTKEPRPQRL